MSLSWAEALRFAAFSMADLFSITAPMLVRRGDGARHIMAECFPLAEIPGLVYFELYWHLQRPATQAIHVVRGEIRGEGPWKIADSVIDFRLSWHGSGFGHQLCRMAAISAAGRSRLSCTCSHLCLGAQCRCAYRLIVNASVCAFRCARWFQTRFVRVQ